MNTLPINSPYKIKIENLSVIIEEKVILNNIELGIKPKITTCIIGKSGAGKSTLLRSIVHFLNSKGKIYVDSKITTDYSVLDLRKKMTYVPQIPSSFPGSCRNNIAWARSVWNLKTDENIISQLHELVGLDKNLLDKEADSLSVGQLQKLSLARALAIEPDVLLLDEPASALDAMSKENFEKIIMDIRKSNQELTVVLVTHDIQQAKRLADEIILINEGKAILKGGVENFFTKLESRTDSDLLKSLIAQGNS